MKIIVHEMATYTIAQQLSKALACRGHEVAYLYCPAFQTPSRSSMGFSRGDKVTVFPVELDSEFAKRNFAKRFLQERAYGAKVAALMTCLCPDLIVSGDTPIETQAAILKMCRRSSTPFLLWMQDIYSIGIKAVISKVPIIGPLVAARYISLERRVARNSDAIVVISEDFRDLVIEWGVDPRRIAIIENWAALPVGPLPLKDNDWAARHGLLNKRIFLYSGALGFKHNPQLFLDLASEFRDEADIRIVVISEGYGAEWLARRRREFPQLVLLPFQPAVDFQKALASADVLVAVLQPEASKYSVPSKVLSYMTAGKPILAAIPAENLATRTILAASAGVSVDPENPSELRRLARCLIEDRDRCRQLGTAALTYAGANFQIDGIATRFEQIFHRCAEQRLGSMARSFVPDDLTAPLR
jgi:colanic acid biosynthesis glycosyl transferase WcaI